MPGDHAAIHGRSLHTDDRTLPLQLADLTALGHLDQYHYLGTQACDHVIELLGIQADASVLDIGSGIGGPARYLSANTGCQVVGVELQAELTDAGAELTARVEGLAERVAFVTGDFSSDDDSSSSEGDWDDDDDGGASVQSNASHVSVDV